VTSPDDAASRTRTTTSGPDRALEEQLSKGLDVYNEAASGMPDQGEFSVKVEDEEGGLVAGLTGWSWGTCAGISMVWVRPDARHSGWGGRLLAAAEDVARTRSCDRIFVSSFTFQAPGFYERHGYAECARIVDYPLDGSADVYLRKDL
jgi:ribosomal protein S18 acetylase RimI-like enzyme